jgi:hypothetical protein
LFVFEEDPGIGILKLNAGVLGLPIERFKEGRFDRGVLEEEEFG